MTTCNGSMLHRFTHSATDSHLVSGVDRTRCDHYHPNSKPVHGIEFHSCLHDGGYRYRILRSADRQTSRQIPLLDNDESRRGVPTHTNATYVMYVTKRGSRARRFFGEEGTYRPIIRSSCENLISQVHSVQVQGKSLLFENQ